MNYKGVDMMTQTYNTLQPQDRKVLDYLMEEGSITNGEANMVLRCRSVSKRISTLTKCGVEILKKYRKDVTGQRHVRYELLNVPQRMNPDVC